MARKLRLEYEGAVYHVISRGNYRADVFGRDSTKVAFLKCLGEAAEKSAWIVHAWCVMSNHYHLCFTTPRANLVEGMRWLQATFSNRFNRVRNEHGHVFQGRYKAPPVEPDATGAVCHYIHLNSVRAGLTSLSAIERWPWSSLPTLMNGRQRPAWYSPEPALAHAGGLDDTPAGRRRYLDYLGWLNADEAGQKELAFDRMAKDWAVGERGFKADLLEAYQELGILIQKGEDGPREISMAFWSARLETYLALLKKTPHDITTEAKGASWKVAIAAAMKTTTTASNPWLASQLNMGSPFRLCRLVSTCRATPAGFQPHVKKIAKCKA